MSRFLQDELGQDMVEYALIAGLIGLGAVVALNNVASSVGTVFSAVGTSLTAPV